MGNNLCKNVGYVQGGCTASPIGIQEPHLRSPRCSYFTGAIYCVLDFSSKAAPFLIKPAIRIAISTAITKGITMNGT